MSRRGGGWRDEAAERLSVEEVKKRVPIERLLTYYRAQLPSNRSWSTWTAMKCPFHPDTNPSASVNRQTGRFRCHGCDVGGDIFEIAQQREGLPDFTEAMAWILRTFL